MSHRHLAAAGLALVLVVSGCAAQPSDDAPVAAPSSGSGSTTAPTTETTPSTVPTTAPSIDPADYTCETILPQATLDVFQDQESEGFVLQDDFAERSRNFGSDLIYFVDFGGILCQWGYPSGAQPVNYGFSAITDEQAAERTTSLTAGGFVEQDDPRGTLLVNADPVSFPDTYLFVDGYWFYGSDADMLDIIAANVPLS